MPHWPPLSQPVSPHDESLVCPKPPLPEQRIQLGRRAEVREPSQKVCLLVCFKGSREVRLGSAESKFLILIKFLLQNSLSFSTYLCLQPLLTQSRPALTVPSHPWHFALGNTVLCSSAKPTSILVATLGIEMTKTAIQSVTGGTEGEGLGQEHRDLMEPPMLVMSRLWAGTPGVLPDPRNPPGRDGTCTSTLLLAPAEPWPTQG